MKIKVCVFAGGEYCEASDMEGLDLTGKEFSIIDIDLDEESNCETCLKIKETFKTLNLLLDKVGTI